MRDVMDRAGVCSCRAPERLFIHLMHSMSPCCRDGKFIPPRMFRFVAGISH
jgi:hypothetical protein